METRVVFAVPWRVWAVLAVPLPVLVLSALVGVVTTDHLVFRPWGAVPPLVLAGVVAAFGWRLRIVADADGVAFAKLGRWRGRVAWPDVETVGVGGREGRSYPVLHLKDGTSQWVRPPFTPFDANALRALHHAATGRDTEPPPPARRGRLPKEPALSRFVLRLYALLTFAFLLTACAALIIRPACACEPRIPKPPRVDACDVVPGECHRAGLKVEITPVAVGHQSGAYLHALEQDRLKHVVTAVPGLSAHAWTRVENGRDVAAAKGAARDHLVQVELTGRATGDAVELLRSVLAKLQERP